VGGLVALAAAGLIGASTVASAATADSPIVPPAFGSAHSSTTAQTVASTYFCDFSGYGGTDSDNFQASLSVPRTAITGEPAAVTLTTPALPLPSAVGQQMAGADAFTVTASGVNSSWVSDATSQYLSYRGASPSAAATPAQIPAITATATVTYLQPGDLSVSNVSEFVITPSAGGKALAPITCQDRSAARVGYHVTVTTPPAPSLPGPVYACTFGIPGVPGGSVPFSAPLPMTLSAAGSRTVGSTDEVTLSSGSDGLGAAYPQGTTALAFSGSLPVTGAQHGSIPLRRYTTDTSSTTFRVSGPLYLARPGTDQILFPNQFTFTIFGPKNPVNGKPVSIVLSCRSKVGTVALTLKVTGKAVATGGGGTTANGAVPAGAPNTGGGPRPGSDVPMAVGGAALLLIGAGFVVVAARRRRGQPVS
jgi:hypothetical protein